MPDDSYKIPEADLKKLVDAKDTSIFILDIRAEADYDKGHIEGAINIPFKKVGSNLDKLPQDKKIIVYCYTGQTGGQTTALLNIAGFEARSLNGGMNNGWAKAGFPVVTK
jgi:rhodanese-related sulfurtransferase